MNVFEVTPYSVHGVYVDSYVQPFTLPQCGQWDLTPWRALFNGCGMADPRSRNCNYPSQVRQTPIQRWIGRNIALLI